MISVIYNLTGDEAIYQGDDYQSPLFGLDDFSPLGGPVDPIGTATVSAQIRDSSGDLMGIFEVDVVDEENQTFRLLMSSADTSGLPITDPVGSVLQYDVQVVHPATWGTKTVFRGKVKVFGQVTR